MTIATIVTALDLAPGSERVAARARQLAAQHGAKLIAVHIIEDFPGGTPLPQGLDTEALVSIAEDDAHARLRGMLGPEAEIQVGSGRPHEAILQAARDRGTDLVIIGPGVPRGLRERVFGSTADRVSRCAPCPVLIVRQDAAGPYRRVITGMDFSAHAQAAARWALRIAPEARQSIVHGDDIPLGFEQSMLKTGTSQAEITRYRSARTRIARQKLREGLAASGLDAQTDIRIRQGNPAAVVLASARRADLVVIGTQGMNAVAQRMLGSVARKVLMHATCDTLAVPGP